MKKIGLALFMCIIMLILPSCLKGQNPRVSKVLHSENSCWKAEQVNMVLCFSDGSSPTSKIDHGFGSFEYPVGSGRFETGYFNGKLTYNENQYYLNSEMYMAGGLIYINAYIKDSEIISARKVDKADFLVDVINKNHFTIELRSSDFLSFPEETKIDFYRIIDYDK